MRFELTSHELENSDGQPDIIIQYWYVWHLCQMDSQDLGSEFKFCFFLFCTYAAYVYSHKMQLEHRDKR